MADEPSPTPDQTTTETPPAPPPGNEEEVAKWKSLARKNEAEAKRLKGIEAELEKYREAQQSDQEKALEQARKEAAEAATAEATKRANRRILTAEIKAAAGTRLADPADAVRLLDLDEFEVDEDGEVDAKAISAAIEDLLKSKPYLASNGTRPAGGADQGARTDPSRKLDDSPRGLITAGLEASQKARSRH